MILEFSLIDVVIVLI